MKQKILALLLLLSSCCMLQAQEDSLHAGRYIMRSFLIGAGKANVMDTYLSPLEYKGPEIRLLHESMRMTRLMKGNVSSQSLVQVNFSYTKNPSKTAHAYTGMINWNYALHYRFSINEHLKILAGPMLDLNAGVIYNQRNTNNPAQAKGYGNIAASGMVIYKFHVSRYPLTVRYQANLPLLGIMFSPEYGESYYEIFTLKNGGKNVLFTSLHNNPSLRQLITIDFPVRKATIRAGYVCDIQQSKVNNLKSHIYSHNFMVGFVKNFYLLKGKDKINMPHNVTPF